MKENPQMLMFFPILLFFTGALTGLFLVRTAKDKNQKYERLFYLITTWGILYGIYACWLNWKNPLLGLGLGALIAAFAALIGFVLKKLKI